MLQFANMKSTASLGEPAAAVASRKVPGGIKA
jgi:hypothetical protein